MNDERGHLTVEVVAAADRGGWQVRGPDEQHVSHVRTKKEAIALAEGLLADTVDGGVVRIFFRDGRLQQERVIAGDRHSSRSKRWLVVSAVVMGVAILGGAGLILLRWDNGASVSQDPLSGEVTMPSAPVLAGFSCQEIDTSTLESSPRSGSGPPETSSSAEQELRQLQLRDQPLVDLLIGSWVPQLSSKRDGIQDATGRTWLIADILTLHRQLNDQHEALTAWSGDFVSGADDLWLAVVPLKCDNGTAALNWCAVEEKDGDSCFAKLLTTDESIPPEATTQLPTS